MFFVYIIQSLKDYSYYFGITTNPGDRLIGHGRKNEKYTRQRGPWILVWCSPKRSRRDAVSLERKLKNLNSKDRITQFIEKNSTPTAVNRENHASL